MNSPLLYSLIEQHAASELAADKSNQSIADAINNARIITQVDSKEDRSTDADIQRVLDNAEYTTYRQTMKAIAAGTTVVDGVPAERVDGVLALLAGGGLAISEDKTQGLLSLLEPSLGETITSKIKLLGIISAPVHEETVTAANVAAAKQWKIDSVWLADAYNRASAGLTAGRTRTEIVALFAGTE